MSQWLDKFWLDPNLLIPKQKPISLARQDPSHPYSTNTIARCILNENIGTLAKDISGNGWDGDLTNGPTWANGGVEFDGTNDFIQFANTANNLTFTEFSIFVRFIAQTNITSHRTIASQYRGGFDGWTMLVRDSDGSNGDKINCTADTDVTSAAVGSINALTMGQEYTAIFDYDGANIRLYLDDILEQTVALTGTITSAYDMALGCERPGSPALYHQGTILDYKIRDKASTAAERFQFYHDPYQDLITKSSFFVPSAVAVGGTTTLHQTTNYQGMNRMNGAMR